MRPISLLQRYPVTDVVNDDKVIATVTYRVNGHQVAQDIYTWTFVTTEPRVISALANPGVVDPGFDSDVYEYVVTLAAGTKDTDLTLNKNPGDLEMTMVHNSAAANGPVTVCTNCAFARVCCLYDVVAWVTTLLHVLRVVVPSIQRGLTNDSFTFCLLHMPHP